MTLPRRQLLLDIHTSQIPTLDNFVPGGNLELLDHLDALADRKDFAALYLWGPAGCGRSHLLQATARNAAGRRPVTLLNGSQVGSELNAKPGELLIVDDVDRLSAEAQIALFRSFNAARLAGLALLLAGPAPALELALREDLRTRIGQCLIYQVKPLDEEEKAAALARHAAARNMQLDPALIQYLLRHGRRDLPSLLAAVDALDLASLEQKRPATLPLLREVLQSRDGGWGMGDG
ncbi:MAG TPA: DnaA regulatory inactivator Hda [Rhodocyclaceae bacterium]